MVDVHPGEARAALDDQVDAAARRPASPRRGRAPRCSRTAARRRRRGRPSRGGTRARAPARTRGRPRGRARCRPRSARAGARSRARARRGGARSLCSPVCAAVELERGLLLSFASVSRRSFGIFVSAVVASASSVVIPAAVEPLDLKPGDPGDEREVVVVAPTAPCRARGTRRASSGRPGTGRSARRLDRVEEPLPQPAVVGDEVVGPEGLALAEPVDDVHRARAAGPGSARAARCRSRAEARAAAWRAARAWCRRPRSRARCARRSRRARASRLRVRRPGRRRRRCSDRRSVSAAARSQSRSSKSMVVTSRRRLGAARGSEPRARPPCAE